jgi:hypothetical protein
MAQTDNEKPVLMDRQSFNDLALAIAVAVTSNTTQAETYYTFYSSRYNAFIASHKSVMTPSYFDALYFISEELKPYNS